MITFAPACNTPSKIWAVKMKQGGEITEGGLILDICERGIFFTVANLGVRWNLFTDFFI